MFFLIAYSAHRRDPRAGRKTRQESSASAFTQRRQGRVSRVGRGPRARMVPDTIEVSICDSTKGTVRRQRNTAAIEKKTHY